MALSAHKLAAQSNIALPGLLADRVARFLRNEFLFGQFVNVLAVPLVTATRLKRTSRLSAPDSELVDLS